MYELKMNERSLLKFRSVNSALAKLAEWYRCNESDITLLYNRSGDGMLDVILPDCPERERSGYIVLPVF